MIIILSLKQISKTYVTGKKTIKAVDCVSYNFYTNNLYVIYGNSGSGKTTLLNIIGLLDEPSNGEIIIHGKNVTNISEKDKTNIRKDKIGFIFQNFYLDKQLKSYENVMLPLLLNKKIKNKKEKALSLLREFDLYDRADHYPKALSGGEQQRVAIARALANNPSIILADEPTGNLDEKNADYVFEKLKKLSKNGKCVIVVTHSKEAKKYADKILYMKNGKLSEQNEI